MPTTVPTDIEQAPLFRLAAIIRQDWRKADGTPNIWFGAVPYVDALECLTSIDDTYGAEDGRSIVAYLLANLAQWRGPVARAVKAELKRRCRYSH